jgi:uncharacterized DUF497 family protein
MHFEWDAKKANSDFRKHAVAFEEAVTSLLDVLAVTGRDPDHSLDEERYVTFGMSAQGRLLLVSHTDRQGIVRIVSARQATKSERKIYEEY